MTNREFSDSFTTLLNSYNLQANFGEDASKFEISLDEYEKSVLLTQAQDIIVKSYFDRTFNQQGQGFDDSTRRQVDFSSLIKVSLLTPVTDLGEYLMYDERGSLFRLPKDVLFVLNEKLLVDTTVIPGTAKSWTIGSGDDAITYYSEPNVKYTDLSTYYTINDGETKYYTEPNKKYHAATVGYYLIDGDKTHYDIEPVFTYHPSVIKHWTINSDSTKYYEKPVKQYIEGNEEYWTINNGSVKYTEEPIAQFSPAVRESWSINDSPVTYNEEPVKTSVTESLTYYTINDDPTKYLTIPVFTEHPAVAAYWTIEEDETHYAYEPIVVYHAGNEHYWTVNGSGRYITEPNIIYRAAVGYYINSATSERYDTAPVIHEGTVHVYYTVTVNNVETGIIYFEDPTNDIEETSEGTWYIGDAGPYSYEPQVVTNNEDLTYYTINDGTTKYYVEPVNTFVGTAESWRFDGVTYQSEPVVVEYAAVAPYYTVTVNNVTLETTYEKEPKIISYAAQEAYWTTNVNDEKYSSEPSYNTETSSTTYYKLSVTGDTKYLTDPTIHYHPAVAAYYFIDGINETYSTAPSIQHISAVSSHWSVNVNSESYDSEPIITEHEATNGYYTSNVNDITYEFKPTVKTIKSVAAHWTIDVTGDISYNSEPNIELVEDNTPGLKYYTINDGDIHYEEEPTFVIKEGIPATKTRSEYIIVPISYREYDREMSKPYGQPLKRQAWRLFQNNTTSFDFDSELIPRFNIQQSDIIEFIYKIRYVRRPKPIILEDLPNGLEIENISTESSCELNPILHVDILNKAVELAFATRSKGQPQTEQRRQ
jgi:hypothetical protein